MDVFKMIDIHKKLLNGVNIDPKDVSVLLLGGIINILSQHDDLVELEQRIKDIEHKDITHQTRIESLENWVLKQGEDINLLNEKLEAMDLNGAIVKESLEIEVMKKKNCKPIN